MKATEILTKSKAVTANLIEKAPGNHESIYKAGIFEGLDEHQKRSIRKKFRKHIQELLSAILTAKEPNLTKLCTEFTNFYKEAYRVNDYTLASIASGKTSEATKATLTQGLEKVKAFYTPNKPKKK